MPPKNQKIKIIRNTKKKVVEFDLKSNSKKGGELKSTDDGLEDYEGDETSESDYDILEDQEKEDKENTPMGQLQENLEEADDDNLDDNVDYDDKDLEEVDNFQEEEPEEELEEPESDTEVKVKDDDCYVKFAGKKKSGDESDDDGSDVEVVFDDDLAGDQIEDKYVPADKRITKPVLARFERVRVLADRSKQLLLGAKPMIKNTANLTPKEIARLELEHGVIPFNIERQLPNGKIESWKISELRIVN